MGQGAQIKRLTKKHDELVLMLQCIVAKYGTLEIDLATTKRVLNAAPDDRKVSLSKTPHGTMLLSSNMETQEALTPEDLGFGGGTDGFSDGPVRGDSQEREGSGDVGAGEGSQPGAEDEGRD